MFDRYTFGSALNGKTNMGFGAAISVVMFLIIAVITLVLTQLLKKLEKN